ncbi:hypothetical protein D9757_006766 [Collybiopsis confluens]|uniref:Uncharacterized protein n=1 Tax=Collybiopsis confluens TaxID=2823264 RepID=A0A8H5M8T4_9AGAR|nr:hypothetical protein D9757_006766 [Collybiopsis confluens]
MRAYIREILLLTSCMGLVRTLQIDVPSIGQRRCEIPATITRDSDSEPEVFVLGYVIEDIPGFTGILATPTDTGLTPQTVLFSIASPGQFQLQLIDQSDSAVLATSTPFVLSNSIDPCPPV